MGTTALPGASSRGADLEGDRRTPLHFLVLQPDSRLQGLDGGNASRRLLPRPPRPAMREPARGFSPALFDLHDARLEARAAISGARAPRRDAQQPPGTPLGRGLSRQAWR